MSLVDEESRRRFRAFIDERVPELKGAADDDTPEPLDYRRWFDYRPRMRTQSSEGVELERKLRVLGSGGEQGVPNYLLVLALAKLMFDNAKARLRPLLFDEAFYGIDAGRRDQLLGSPRSSASSCSSPHPTRTESRPRCATPPLSSSSKIGRATCT